MKHVSNWGLLPLITIFFLVFGTQDTYSQVKKRTVRRVTAVQYTIPAGTRLRVRINESLSSKTARVGERFTTVLREPVYSVSGILLMPIGTIVNGRVNAVKPARKGGDPGTIDVAFTSLKLPNGKTKVINGSLYDLSADKARSDNEGTATGTTMRHRKLIFIGGGAAGGAIIGGMVGGGKGAVIGGLLGTGAGILGERLTHGSEAEVRAGEEFGVYLNRSIAMTRWAELLARQD